MIIFGRENLLAKMWGNDFTAGTLLNTSESGYVSDLSPYSGPNTSTGGRWIIVEGGKGGVEAVDFEWT